MTYSFKERLGDLVNDRKISQERLAEAVGIKRQTVASYISGRTKPDTEIIFRIAEFFNVSADYLLGLSDIPTIDPDINAAAKLTGLTSDSISTFKLLRELGIKKIQRFIDMELAAIQSDYDFVFDEETETVVGEDNSQARMDHFLYQLLPESLFGLILQYYEAYKGEVKLSSLYFNGAQPITTNHSIGEYILKNFVMFEVNGKEGATINANELYLQAIKEAIVRKIESLKE